MFKMIRLGSAEDVEQAVEKYLQHTSASEKSLQQYHIDIMELISALYRFSMNHEIADGFWEISGRYTQACWIWNQMRCVNG